MAKLDRATLASLRHDPHARETRLREVVGDCLATAPPPVLEDAVVATYFLSLRTWSLAHAASEISYHATSGAKSVPPGSLLEACTGRCVGVEQFDTTGRLGLLHVAFPLKMLLHPDGRLTSCDILHTVAGAVIFDLYENQDVRLVRVTLPERVIRTFPGPAYGPEGVRELTHFGPLEPAFGTILKPTAGITPGEVGALVAEAAACPLFMFIKEDENLYPRLDYSPVAERVRQAVQALERASAARRGKGLIFAPHVTGAPGEILETVQAVVAAGARGVMFSESFSTGTVRLVREATRSLPSPPAIYGHNGGIGVKTRGGIWREVIDMFARLDGIDFRQTAPVRPGPPFIYPAGREWIASEHTLVEPLPGIKPVMIARAGGLDQGNIILNLADAERRGLSSSVLFLAGSAINSITDASGKPNPRLGTEAMQQAIEVHASGELSDVSPANHVRALAAVAKRRRLKALGEALRQRYSSRAGKTV
jgi:ribulose 1,5-bisphosphate carboxylase large subunit-like protein